MSKLKRLHEDAAAQQMPESASQGAGPIPETSSAVAAATATDPAPTITAGTMEDKVKPSVAPFSVTQTWNNATEPARNEGHSALRVKAGKIETFDPHPKSEPAAGGETPETDALRRSGNDEDKAHGLDDLGHYMAATERYSDLCRSLERQRNALQVELAATKRELADAKADAKSWADQCGERVKDWDAMRERAEKAARELAELRKSLDEAKVEFPLIECDIWSDRGHPAVSEKQAKSIRQAAIAIIAKQKMEIEALKAENFSLAAHQCIVPGGLCGDEYGNQYCALERKHGKG